MEGVILGRGKERQWEKERERAMMGKKSATLPLDVKVLGKERPILSLLLLGTLRLKKYNILINEREAVPRTWPKYVQPPLAQYWSMGWLLRYCMNELTSEPIQAFTNSS